jgi:hypothetical protein
MKHIELKRVREQLDEIPIISDQTALNYYVYDTIARNSNRHVAQRAKKGIFSYILGCCRRLLKV